LATLAGATDAVTKIGVIIKNLFWARKIKIN
jgi:hypothetical protein